MEKRLPYGILIALEGIDGAGKTTQAELLVESLKRHHFDVVRTKEPTGGPWGQRIRHSASTQRMNAAEELAAFIEDRRQHVGELIEPSLNAGKIVVVDRYYYSTVAYQGVRGHDPADLLRVNESFAPRPDLLVLLDVPPHVGRRRIASRGDTANLFEDEAALTAVAEIFSTFKGPRTLRLDGLQSIESIANEILYTVLEGPVADRLNRDSLPAGPVLTAERIRTILSKAEEISNSSTTADGDKAAKLLSEVLKIES